MSSDSSLLTTAASDTSSSADSRYVSSGAHYSSARRGYIIDTAREVSTSFPAVQWSSPPLQSCPARSSRRRSYNLKARGVVIAKDTSSGGNQKVFCVCKGCKGQRIVSKSTCYRHLRLEAEVEGEDVNWDAQWGTHHVDGLSHEEALRMHEFIHSTGLRLGF
uniref:Uncharacterized protein n=1 Tax=Physcomitrium patens TaxID=3218 RepID=A0A2K1IU36_PHYPA|nr:hypothetical protein PHYPA_024733 [Physcomitrium patens]